MFHLYPANTAQLREQAFALRREVFVTEQRVPAEDEIDAYEDESHHLLLFNDDQAVATARWRQTTEGIKLERFAVRSAWRNQGIGRQLLEAVLNDIQRQAGPGQHLYLHAQLLAVPFYARAGFDRVGDEFDECGIRHVRMDLTR